VDRDARVDGQHLRLDTNQLKLIAIAALLSLTCVAQSPAPAPSSSLDNWAGVGSIYNSSGSPRWSGYVALAVPVSAAAQVYSFSLDQWTFVDGKLVNSTTTGVATILREFKTRFGTLFVLGLGTAGVSTGSTSTTGAFAGGGGALWRWLSGLTAQLFGIQNKVANAVGPELLGGIGYTWGGK
jgi:hypothetical protein